MQSILKYFDNNGLSYKASSSTPFESASGTNNAFNKDGNRFQTQENPSYWQVSFSEAVTIGSYIISGGSIKGNSITSWDISYSFDGTNFINLQTDSIKDLRGNTKRFPLKKQIYCKCFKITGRTTTTGSCYLYFYCFDCFLDGFLKRKNLNSYNIPYFKRKWLSNELIILMAFIISY